MAATTPEITQNGDHAGMLAMPSPTFPSGEAYRLSALQQLSRAATQSAIRLSAHCDSVESIVALQGHIINIRRQIRRLKKHVVRQSLQVRLEVQVPARLAASPPLSPASKASTSPTAVQEESPAPESIAEPVSPAACSTHCPSPAPSPAAHSGSDFEAGARSSASPSPEPVPEAPTTPVKRRECSATAASAPSTQKRHKHKSMTPAEQSRKLALLDAKLEEYRESVRAREGVSPGV